MNFSNKRFFSRYVSMHAGLGRKELMPVGICTIHPNDTAFTPHASHIIVVFSTSPAKKGDQDGTKKDMHAQFIMVGDATPSILSPVLHDAASSAIGHGPL